MPAKKLFEEPMIRVFIRVPAATFDECERRARLRKVKPGTIARELLELGLQESGVPAIVQGLCTKSLNVSLPESIHAAILRVAKREAQRIGEPVDTATAARRLLHRGIEAAEQPRRLRKTG